MGNTSPPPPPQVLDDPWRTIQWTTTRKEQLMDFIKNYKPSMSSVEKACILLIGPVGAGKSSFFNSINSVYRGHVTIQALSGIQGTSVTSQYRTYSIKESKGGQPLPLFLCDTMGLEDGLNAGLNVEDMDNILRGNIPDRYVFHPVSPRAHNATGDHRPGGIKNRIHCVVFVIDTHTLPVISEQMKRKLTDIIKKSNSKGVPQMVILTKIDEACRIVKKDLTKVYHSVYIKEKVEEASVIFGIPVSSVLPVKNYN